MRSTLNHRISRTFVSWNMVMVLTLLVDHWNMKMISCDPRGVGHRTVTGEGGLCTLDVPLSQWKDVGFYHHSACMSIYVFNQQRIFQNQSN